MDKLGKEKDHSHFKVTLKLRWAALISLLFIIYAAEAATAVVVDWGILLPAFALGLATNLLGWFFSDRFSTAWKRQLSRALLILDSVLLAVILSGSGGAHNPLSSLYLLLVVIAAILHNRLTASIIAVIAFTSFAYLYLGMPELCHDAVGISHDLHIQGMIVVLGIMSAAIVLFIENLKAAFERAQQKLQERERLDAIATLATGVAHELATPLSTIAVAAKELELVACKNCMEGDCIEDARLIREQVDRCRQIIDRMDLQNLNELRTPSETVDLATIEEGLRPRLKKDIQGIVRFHIGKAPIYIRAPKELLLQSIISLIDNASRANVNRQPIDVEISRANDQAIMKIRDYGLGMSAEVCSQIGNPFFTTRPRGEGLGMGVFIAKSLIANISGKMTYHSKQGQGTTIIIELPLATYADQNK